MQLVSAHVLGRAPLTGSALLRADSNHDHIVDAADLTAMQLGPLPPQKTFMLPGGVRLVMVRIPPGTFQMGLEDEWASSDSNEGPVHQVTIDYDLYLGKFEITQGQWHALIPWWPDFGPSPLDGYGDNYPVYSASWNDVQGFEGAINSLGLGGTFRLPSEAEWEYGARCGTQTRFPFGPSNCSVGSCDACDLSEYAWWCGNNTGSRGEPGYGSKPVGQKLPNPFGLYDTIGNVNEWCEDYIHFGYTGAPTDGSAWLSPPSNDRVMRGGNWGARAAYCLPTIRGGGYANGHYNTFGFRIAWTP